MDKFRFAYIFSDNCILQRGKEIAVWGFGADGLEVSVSLEKEGNVLSGPVKSIIDGGRWKVMLPAVESGEGLMLKGTCGNETVSFSNIAMGEVWLAGGQSNMELMLCEVTAGDEMLANDKPNVRFYATPKYEYEDDKFLSLQTESRWEFFDSEKAKSWSAVGYIFAKNISEALNVPVGIIGCNWGGTSASAWINPKDFENAWGDVKSYLEEYMVNNAGKSLDEQYAEYVDYLEYRKDWEPKCNAMYAGDPDMTWDKVVNTIGDSRYPGPVNAFNPMRPCGLYTTMLSKVIEYSMRGVIYYQGESDDHKPWAYFNLFNALVKRWRIDNGDSKLPFIAVQLPMHRFSQDPDLKNWPVIRQNQRRVVNNTENMGLAVGIDCGEFNNIHPKDKREISRRLALQALWFVYGAVSAAEANAPRLNNLEFKEDCVLAHFDYADGGFTFKGGKATGFEIAPFKYKTEDSDYVPADIEDLGNGTVRIHKEGLHNPGAVRYLWTNWAEVTVYGKNGLPLEPFGTF